LDTIQPVVTIPLTLDSPDPAVLEMAFQMVERLPMINSINLEKKQFDAIIPFLTGKDCKIIALCMDDAGMPASSDDIINRADTLVKELNTIGIENPSIYIDPLVQPISTGSKKGLAKNLGMLIEEGLLTGVGETIDDLADSILLMRNFSVEQARGMTFVPQKDTPMAYTMPQNNLGDKIPSELKLAKLYQASVETVRHALLLLVGQGYLSRSQGRGTFVIGSTAHTDSLRYYLTIPWI